jgi:SSS family solute:Na+ symporter
MAGGTGMVWALGMKGTVYPVHLPAALGGGTCAMYAAVPALVLNLAVSAGLTAALRAAKVEGGVDATDAGAYGD